MIDTSNIQPIHRGALPSGAYYLTFVSSKPGKANSTDTDSVSVEYEVQGRTVYFSWWITEKTMPYVLGDLHVIFGSKLPVFQAADYTDLANQIALGLSKGPREIYAELGRDSEGHLVIERFLVG